MIKLDFKTKFKNTLKDVKDAHATMLVKGSHGHRKPGNVREFNFI